MSALNSRPPANGLAYTDDPEPSWIPIVAARPKRAAATSGTHVPPWKWMKSGSFFDFASFFGM